MNLVNTMAEIIIYSKDPCPYCVRAKMLLQRKGRVFKEIKVTNEKIMEEMLKKSGGMKTVPQIFINGRHVGGCDDLYTLEAKGELDKLLG